MQPLQHSELWCKLDAFDLDGRAQLSFSRRLARDNGWTHGFALRVVEEYKRFVFLAATAGHPVTPSDEVDQAWHLHLVYTRSYWDDLCGGVLGFPLHHGPTKGGASEGAKFGDWYGRTLESYRVAFGEEAPRDIWPEASVRFGDAPHFQRVNVRRVWMIRKPQRTVRFGRSKKSASDRMGIAGRFAPILLLLLMAGCAAPTSFNVSQWNGAEFLGAFWTACAVGLALALFLKTREQPPFDAVFPLMALDAYEVARLKESGNLVVDVALASLHTRGAIEVTDKGRVRSTGFNEPKHPFEQAVLKEVGEENSVLAVRANRFTVQMNAIDQKLREAGLLVSSEVQKNANTVPLAIMFTLLTVGAIRIVVGLTRQRPVGFLVISCVALIVATVWLASTATRRSKRGNLLLENLNQQYNTMSHPMRSFRMDNPARSVPKAPEESVETLAIFFALAGPVAYPADIRRAVAPPSSGGDGGSGCSTGSSDSGSGDGGGDGGGSGCGGCGGCGGGGGD